MFLCGQENVCCKLLKIKIKFNLKKIHIYKKIQVKKKKKKIKIFKMCTCGHGDEARGGLRAAHAVLRHALVQAVVLRPHVEDAQHA